MNRTYVFFPPTGTGEEALAERAPVRVADISFGEFCLLAHGRYRGWEPFQKVEGMQVRDHDDVHPHLTLVRVDQESLHGGK